MTKNAAIPAGDKTALRQTGRFEVHPEACECRKCRRSRAARARRVKPRYGQAPVPDGDAQAETAPGAALDHMPGDGRNMELLTAEEHAERHRP